MLTEYAVPVLLVLSGIALVTAMLGLATWGSSLTGGHPKTVCWAKLFAGVSWVAFGLDGILASAFISDNRLFTYLISWAFLLMGGFVFRSGWRLRKAALAQK
ncbi:MAG: hypothetical protein SGJ27_08080 [Candidatus Melainabacteria bacterium]|nr:hypothetical protein [Candidatus Melainabacteria bacterium]